MRIESTAPSLQGIAPRGELTTDLRDACPQRREGVDREVFKAFGDHELRLRFLQ